VNEPLEVLARAASVLVIDWPSRDVPDSLARAGYAVTVKSGPGPQDFTAQELRDGEVVPRPVGRRPHGVDVVYSHRPLDELPGIVATAQELGAEVVWWQSGLVDEHTKDTKGCWVSEDSSHRARTIVESAGLQYVDRAYIADVVRELSARR